MVGGSGRKGVVIEHKEKRRMSTPEPGDTVELKFKGNVIYKGILESSDSQYVVIRASGNGNRRHIPTSNMFLYELNMVKAKHLVASNTRAI